jgi:hypothetical protein
VDAVREAKRVAMPRFDRSDTERERRRRTRSVAFSPVTCRGRMPGVNHLISDPGSLASTFSRANQSARLHAYFLFRHTNAGSYPPTFVGGLSVTYTGHLYQPTCLPMAIAVIDVSSWAELQPDGQHWRCQPTGVGYDPGRMLTRYPASIDIAGSGLSVNPDMTSAHIPQLTRWASGACGRICIWCICCAL